MLQNGYVTIKNCVTKNAKVTYNNKEIIYFLNISN